MTGLWTSTQSRDQLAADLAGSSSFPANDLRQILKSQNLMGQYPVAANAEVLTYLFYDSYSHPNISGYAFNGTFNSKLTGAAPHAETPPVAASKHTLGLLTGTSVKVMNPGSAVQWLTQVKFYDSKSRVIQTQATNIKGGLDITTNQYEFDGVVISSILFHENPSAVSPVAAYPALHKTTEIVKRFSRNYSSGAIVKVEQNVNGTGWRDILRTTPDEFGRIREKTLSTSFANHYTYNVRGWLTGINPGHISGTPSPDVGPYFGEQIFYDQGFESMLYNGNISGIVWKGAGTSAQKRFYGYSYDKLSRLTHAEFGQWNSTTGQWGKNIVDYTASGIDYDKNGNIVTMSHQGPGYINNNVNTPGMVQMDGLVYSYYSNSNKLNKVKDNFASQVTQAPDFKDSPTDVQDYNYDGNGNLVLDKNKGISIITYNHLNKPNKISVDGKGTIDYVYDASGNRLQKIVQSVNGATETYDYVGSFVYKDNKLQHFVHEEGRCRPVQSSNDGIARYDYDFFFKDHLQNVRTVVGTMPTGLGGMLNPVDYKASLELSLANTEQLIWEGIDEVREDKPGGNPGDEKAAQLEGNNPDRRIGTALMLRVMPGDQFKVGFSSYWDGPVTNPGNVTAQSLAASLLTTLMGGATYSGVPVSELPEHVQTIQSGVGNEGFATIWGQLQAHDYDPHNPDAGLTYMVLDDNFRVRTDKSGFIQVGEQAGNWQTRSMNDRVEIGEPGYLVVFTGSRSSTAIFADNVTVTFYKGSVIEEDHYYPFGLTLNSVSANPSEGNNIKFQSQELQADLGLNTYSYKYREHDMQTGRFWQIDPLADKYAHNSTYAFSENCVTTHLELEGLEKMDFRTHLAMHSANAATAVPAAVGSYLVDWLISPFVQITRGAEKKMESIYINNTKNGYTEYVPQETREIIQEHTENQANLEIIKGTAGVINNYSVLYGLLTGGLLNSTAEGLMPAAVKTLTGLQNSAAPAAVNTAKVELTSAQFGRIIGWGEGQAEEAVQQTINVTTNLTRPTVEGWAKQGLTKSWVQDQLTKYSNSVLKGGDKLKNNQLQYRKELMEKILNLWD